MLITLLAMGVAVAGAVLYIADQKVQEIFKTENPDIKIAEKKLARPLPGEPANILLMGSDFRQANEADGQRSDTMLLVRLDPTSDTISMMSFPRDLWVTIPGIGERKINDAFAEGGPELAVSTVKDLTGLDIHFLSVVDFKGFKGIINELGGVYVDVDQRYYNPEEGGGNYAAIDIRPGYQKLLGGDALAYSRFRHTDSDFHRIARQQHVLGQLKRQVNTTKLARNALGLLDIMDENTEVGVGGGEPPSRRQMLDYMRLAVQLKSSNVYNIPIAGDIGTAANGASIVQVPEARLAGAVDSFLNPDAEARRQAGDQVTGDKTDAQKNDAAAEDDGEAAADAADDIDKSVVTVVVYNGNGVGGSADVAGQGLIAKGWNVDVSGNADNFAYAETTIHYATDDERDYAEEVAKAFDNASVVPATNANVAVAIGQVAVIVGASGTVTSADGAGLGSPSVAPADREKPDNQVVAEKTEARVITDPDRLLGPMQAKLRSARMPMMYPSVIESTTQFDETIRTYKVNGKRAFRIVGKTGENDYWGIQGVQWAKPPLLGDPTRTTIKNGRELEIYMDGTAIHRIAWTDRNTTYWISNSVLNKLSNETMLAIAAGMKRVPKG